MSDIQTKTITINTSRSFTLSPLLEYANKLTNSSNGGTSLTVSELEALGAAYKEKQKLSSSTLKKEILGQQISIEEGIKQLGALIDGEKKFLTLLEEERKNTRGLASSAANKRLLDTAQIHYTLVADFQERRDFLQSALDLSKSTKDLAAVSAGFEAVASKREAAEILSEVRRDKNIHPELAKEVKRLFSFGAADNFVPDNSKLKPLERVALMIFKDQREIEDERIRFREGQIRGLRGDMYEDLRKSLEVSTGAAPNPVKNNGKSIIDRSKRFIP